MNKIIARQICNRFSRCAITLFFIAQAAVADTEILVIRHGEKPADGLGQLSCQGFNRALALPGYMVKTYGRPDVIIAPNPGVQKTDKGIPYAYIRPLATVEPLAVSLEMPVDLSLAFNDLPGLEKRFDDILQNPKDQKVVIAWEHKIAEQVVRNFFDHRGIKAEIPHWDDEDFDSIYIIRQHKNEAPTFHLEKQKLKKLSKKCMQ